MKKIIALYGVSDVVPSVADKATRRFLRMGMKNTIRLDEQLNMQEIGMALKDYIKYPVFEEFSEDTKGASVLCSILNKKSFQGTLLKEYVQENYTILAPWYIHQDLACLSLYENIKNLVDAIEKMIIPSTPDLTFVIKEQTEGLPSHLIAIQKYLLEKAREYHWNVIQKDLRSTDDVSREIINAILKNLKV